MEKPQTITMVQSSSSEMMNNASQSQSHNNTSSNNNNHTISEIEVEDADERKNEALPSTVIKNDVNEITQHKHEEVMNCIRSGKEQVYKVESVVKNDENENYDHIDETSHNENPNNNSLSLNGYSSSNENDQQIFEEASYAEVNEVDVDKPEQAQTDNLEEMATTANGMTNNSIGARMDNNNSFGHHHQHLYEQHSFAPRLPPDGHEFPNSWLDEEIGNSDTTTKIVGADQKVPNNKLYHSEYNVLNAKTSGGNFENPSTRPDSPPPPPPPRTAPPQLEEDSALHSNHTYQQLPPAIPSSQPPPIVARTRRTSIEERRRLFELSTGAQNQHNNKMDNNLSTLPPVTPKSNEPSRKSVKDKIAMFSTSSASTVEDIAQITNVNISSVASPSLSNNRNGHLPPSIPAPLQSNKGYCTMSKSSDHLPGITSDGLEIYQEISTESPKPDSTTNAWKSTKSTSDLRHQQSDLSATSLHHYDQKAPPKDKFQPLSSNLYERSQSLLNVGLTGSANTNNVNNAPSLMEERRRGTMCKLRGLVIPDKPDLGQNSISVMDLPTIYSKDAPSSKPIPNSKPIPKQPPPHPVPLTRKNLARTESLDGMSSSSSSSEYSSRNHKPIIKSTLPPSNTTTDLSDWKFSSALPKYSPAFKRRSLTAYQTAITSPTMKSKLSANFKTTTSTPEPKSLESCTSPRSDSSFEYLSPTSDQPKIVGITTVASMKRNYGNIPTPTITSINNTSDKSTSTVINPVDKNSKIDSNFKTNNKSFPRRNSNGKLVEDSDTDSAVSSSRSSISHELSPPSSPVPSKEQQEQPSLQTQTDEHQLSVNQHQEQRYNVVDQNVIDMTSTTEDSANNSDEGWRILKPQSVEAINRKNILASAKYSNGTPVAESNTTVKLGPEMDISSNGRGKYHHHRRSDDEEASYADAETEDTESSCSELEIGKYKRSSGPSVHHHVVHHNSTSSNTAVNKRQVTDTEDDDEEDEDNMASELVLPESRHHLSHKSMDDERDMSSAHLSKESPLQAIYDMEVKMAYINEICDSLPCTRQPQLPTHENRFFSRRESEATVIEHPIERKSSTSSSTITLTSEQDLRMTGKTKSTSSNSSIDGVDYNIDQVDYSSGSRKNSLVSGDLPTPYAQSSTTSVRRNSVEDTSKSTGVSISNLEKKYSTSMTSVNSLSSTTISTSMRKESNGDGISTTDSPVTTESTSIIEKKIEKITEHKICPQSTNSGPGSIIGSSRSSLGRPKFTPSNIPRGRNDFKSLSEKWQQISSNTTSTTTSANNSTDQHHQLSSLKTTPNFHVPFTKAQEDDITPSARLRSRSGIGENREREREEKKPWIVPRRLESSSPTLANVSTTLSSTTTTSNNTKRSVSVNDIRKAFEKAEIAVNTYGRDDNSSSDNLLQISNKNGNGKEFDSNSILSPPSAHFRVSSFDSTTSEDSSATTPAGIYGSVSNLVSSSSSAQKDPYGSITSLASSTSLISPQELQQLIDEANQSLEEAGTPSHEVSVVILHREFAGGSLGITLAGGADYETKEITVHKVLSASIADRDGRIHRGDRVLSINGKSTKGSTHREALNLLKAPRTEVVLVVSRGRSTSNGFQTIEETSATLDRAVEPLLNGSLASLLENDEDTKYNWGPMRTVVLIKDGAGLGFSLEGGQGSISGDKPLTIKKIFVGGPAEKSGALKVGDLITSINNVNMATKSRTEAWNFMKKLSDGEVKLMVKSPL